MLIIRLIILTGALTGLGAAVVATGWLVGKVKDYVQKQIKELEKEAIEEIKTFEEKIEEKIETK